MNTRIRANIIGRVQGVGFRPTVYRYATQLGLAGFVCNGPEGVTLEVEGDSVKVGAFFDRLASAPPPQALIVDVKKQIVPEKGYRNFQVMESEVDGDAVAHISPDLALCDDCRHEMLDPEDRRYRYPFINCTNCGPRFTIIRSLPYDRPRTSMAEFTMCPRCEREYREPADRRFHAQPDACPECGPKLELLLANGNASAGDPVVAAQELLRLGRVVAIKSLGGYQLACDAANPAAVACLRKRKNRPHKPLAVMFRDIETLRQYCEVSESEEAELLSVARPIVLLARNADGAGLPEGISPDTDTIGAFLPFTPLHHLLMEDFDALVLTSGNRANEPLASDEAELKSLLGAVADAALTHNRAIVHKCDDSVVRIIHGQRQLFRRARGFVPNAIRIAPESPSILAVGGELKNTFCLVRDGNAIVSQHIGDLRDFKTYEHFAGEIAAWQKLMRVEPSVIAFDLHPAYLSTRYAQELHAPVKIGVQHHHAHIVSVMAEHDLYDPVIGIALDGTGYGTDDTVWGGEFMIADRADFERVAHFKQYPIPGGDRAIEEPWRMATSVLHCEGLDATARDLVGPRELHTIRGMITAQFNSPMTSSAGRLFDAVAGILELCDRVSYEAQGAIRLEAAADAGVTDSYPYAVQMRDTMWIVDFGPTIRALVQERAEGIPVSEISWRFHNTVVAALVQRCKFIRAWRGLHTVALSGGVFQNEVLLTRTLAALRAAHFDVFTNVVVPPNDGGLALGQAAVAAARVAQRRHECKEGVAGSCV